MRAIATATLFRKGLSSARRAMLWPSLLVDIQDPRASTAMSASFVFEIVLVATIMSIHTSPYKTDTKIL